MFGSTVYFLGLGCKKKLSKNSLSHEFLVIMSHYMRMKDISNVMML